VAAQEKPKVIPVDNFVRAEQYPGYTQAFGTQPSFDPVQYALRNVFKVPGT
jgi:hypothetical protein